MSLMKAVQVSHAGGAFELVERALPEPEAGQVRLKVAACGICHSDQMVKDGVAPVVYPRIPGHEVIGTIDLPGEGVHPWRIGQRVGVGWHGGHCFVCPACRRGDFINCVNERIAGLPYDGGYAEYMIAPQEALALESGVNRSYMASLENGRRNPSLETMCRLATALRCGVSDLVKGLEALDGRG